MRDLMPATVTLVKGWETTVSIDMEYSPPSGPSVSPAPLSQGTL